MTLLLVMSALMIASCAAWAVDFSAQMIQTVGDETSEGSFYRGAEKYRWMIQESGSLVSVIVDQAAGTTRVLDHSKDTYITIENESPRSLMNNPFEAFRVLSGTHGRTEAGTETVAGYECIRFDVLEGDTLLLSAWVSQELSMPLKVVVPGPSGRQVELDYVSVEEIGDAYFDTPAHFVDVTDTDTAPALDAAPEVSGTETPEEASKTLAAEHEQTVLKKVAEMGIELKTDEGTVTLREAGTRTLESYFPGWIFYNVTRELKLDRGTSLAPLPFGRIIYNVDDGSVVTLSSPGSDVNLSSELAFIQNAGIKLTTAEEVNAFAPAIPTINPSGSSVEEVLLLDENTWAICTGTSFDGRRGYVMELDDAGNVVSLTYSLEIGAE